MESHSPPLDHRIKVPVNIILHLKSTGWILDEEVSKKESYSLEWVVFIPNNTKKKSSKVAKIRICNIFDGECCAKQFGGGRKNVVVNHIKSHVNSRIKAKNTNFGK